MSFIVTKKKKSERLSARGFHNSSVPFAERWFTIMKYKLVILIIFAISVRLTFPSYAAEWQHDNVGGWWYREDDGSYPMEIWKEIQGRWYYFNSDGYLLIDTITPDGYRVGNDGAWIKIDEEQVYEIVSKFLIERGTTG